MDYMDILGNSDIRIELYPDYFMMINKIMWRALQPLQIIKTIFFQFEDQSLIEILFFASLHRRSPYQSENYRFTSLIKIE